MCNYNTLSQLVLEIEISFIWETKDCLWGIVILNYLFIYPPTVESEQAGISGAGGVIWATLCPNFTRQTVCLYILVCYSCILHARNQLTLRCHSNIKYTYMMSFWRLLLSYSHICLDMSWCSFTAVSSSLHCRIFITRINVGIVHFSRPWICWKLGFFKLSHNVSVLNFQCYAVTTLMFVIISIGFALGLKQGLGQGFLASPLARMKCWQFMFLRTTAMFTFVRVIGLVTIFTCLLVCVIFTLHVCSYLEADGMVAEWQKVRRLPSQSLQFETVSIFVSVKPLNIFKETSGHLQPCLLWQNLYFKTKHDLFVTPTK